MSDEIEVVEGWTGPIRLRLYADGVPPDLTGMTVSLILKDKSGFRVSTTGVSEFTVFTSSTPTVITATDGYVQLVPTSFDFSSRRSPYRGRVKVVDGLSRVTYFPSAATSVWTVWEE